MSVTPKNNKKLKKFFVDKSTSVKRIKVLLNYEGSATIEETKEFYKSNHEQVFNLIMDRMAEAESTPKPVRKGKHFLADLQSLFTIVKSFIVYCLLLDENYVDSLETILSKGLRYSNKQIIRLQCFELLVLAIDSLADKSYDCLLPLLIEAINIRPFQEDHLETPNCPSPLNKKGLVPSTTMPSITESVELWNILISMCVKDLAKFDFWLSILKKTYFPMFYPTISQQLHLNAAVDLREEKTFKKCHPKVTETLIRNIILWIKQDSSSQIIQNIIRHENMLLLMSFLNETCNLTIEYSSICLSAINQYWELIFSRTHSCDIIRELLEDHAIEYSCQFIEYIMKVFLWKSTAETLQAHIDLCTKVLECCWNITKVHWKNSKDIWIKLQETLLHEVSNFLLASNPFSVRHISTSMAGEMFRYLFDIWILSPITTESMWKNCSQKLSNLVPWKALLEQWSDKVIQLTLLYRDFYYKDIIEKYNPIKKKPGKEPVKKEEKYQLSSRMKAIEWTKEKIKDVWFTFVHILGNLNSITYPENFSVALNTSLAVVELVLEADDKIPLTMKPFIPIYTIFLPSLIESCSVEEKRNRGRLTAYVVLCKLLCRRSIPSMIHINILVHFYKVLRQGLNSGHSSVIWCILRNASNIFTLNLPGVNVLIPLFIREISLILKPSKTQIPDSVYSKSLQIVASILCIPNHIPGLEFKETLGSPVITMTHLREKIYSVLFQALELDNLTPPNRVYTLNCLTIFIIDNIQINNISPENIEILKILSFCYNDSDIVSWGALECIQTLSNYIDIYLKTGVSGDIIISLCKNIKQLMEESTVRVDLIVQHYHTILVWVLAMGEKITIPIIDEVFTAIEYAFVGTRSRISAYSFIDMDNLPEESDSSDSIKSASKRKRLEKILATNSSRSRKQTLLGGSSTNITIDPKIRDAAKYFIQCYITGLDNYPLPKGATEAPLSVTVEEEISDDIYLLYNNQTIYALKQITPLMKDKPPYLQVIVRDSSGRYEWECQYKPNDIEWDCKVKEQISKIFEPETNPGKTVFSKKEEPIKSENPEYTRKKESIPPFDGKFNFEEIDIAQETLNYLRELNVNYIPSGISHQEVNSEVIESFNLAINQQVASEKELLFNRDTREEMKSPLPLFPESPKPQSLLHLCRLFLSHMGLIEEIHLQRIVKLQKNARLLRALKELDKTNCKEMIKIGLIYVKPGQDNQRDILANDIASKRYTEFSAGIGWSIDLETHGFYKGGLAGAIAGKTAPYFANELYEVIFHDITRMPTSADDKQQIHKKRHVGNDNIHIVWSENKREYNPETITSQFNDAHIVIYPLSNGLNSIRIFKKDKLGTFGPLVTGMVIPSSILPILVRITAMNANYSSRLTTEIYKKPPLCRMDLIKEIATRYTDNKDFSCLITDLFTEDKENGFYTSLG